MVLIPLVNVFYKVLNNSSNGIHYLVTNIDKNIPFLKIFIIPYIMWYPFIIGTFIFFCYYDREVYYRCLLSMVLGMLICYVCYYFFQTMVPRPEVLGDDILTKLVRVIYKTDEPFNCFPSIHVLSCYIIMKGAYKSSIVKKKSFLSINIIGILVILSTQFIKQHVLLDLVFAIILGEILYRIMEKIMHKESVRKNKVLLWWTMKKKLEDVA